MLWPPLWRRIQRVSPWDKISLATLFVILLAIFLTLFAVWQIFLPRVDGREVAVLYGGFALQAVYLSGTPCFLRSYDVEGHIQYINYVASHFALPGQQSGWETYQPPLYYRIKDKTAHDIVIRSFDTGAITSRMIPTVLHEYREPRHEVKQKEQLQAQLAQIDAELESLESGTPLPKKRGRKPGRPRGVLTAPAPAKRGRRSKRLKDSLLTELTAAGAAGITVKELSARLNVKPSNVFSWFYTTGKKVKGVKKVGEAKYSYTT